MRFEYQDDDGDFVTIVLSKEGTHLLSEKGWYHRGATAMVVDYRVIVKGANAVRAFAARMTADGHPGCSECGKAILVALDQN